MVTFSTGRGVMAWLLATTVMTATFTTAFVTVGLVSGAGATQQWNITKVAPPGAVAATSGNAVASAAPLRPSVKGNLLLDSGGGRLVLKGAAAYLMPFYAAPNGGPDPGLASVSTLDFANRDAIFAAMKAVGINTVRVPVGTGGIAGDPYGLGGPAGYVNRLSQIVQSADRAGLHVIIGWWDSLGEGATWPRDASQEFAMMGQVVAAVGNDANVMFEPWNEPNGVTWSQWLATMTETLIEFRATFGYHGVLFVDTINWSWSFDPTQARLLETVDAALNVGGSQLVFANHRYANDNTCFCGAEAASWQNEVGQYVSTFPIAGTEYGYWNGVQFAPQPRWSAQLLSTIAAAVPAGFNGYCDFVWDWVDANSMIGGSGVHTAGELTQLNEHGQLAERFFARSYG